MVEKMKAFAFEKVDYKEWESTAENSLRGRSLETLTTKLIEGVEIQPLYTNESAVTQDDRQKMQQIIQHSKVHPSWRIIQPTYANDAKTLIQKVKQSLENGNEAIYYDGRCGIEWNDEDLNEFAKLVTKKYPLCVQHVDEGDSFLNLYHLIDKSERHKVRGPFFHDMTNLPDGYNNFRDIPISTVGIHHEGADIITELAVSLAIASETIAKNILPIEKFPKHALFQFAVDTNFFQEIAKLRAFRILWHTFASAYGHSNIKVPIYAETSLRTHSKLDPNVNMLRAGNEALSAVLGGADMVTVYPHTSLTKMTDTAERFARNIQLILKEEMEIDFVKDVASGSYYIDTLTKTLVDEAWELFLQIEEFGGYEKYVEAENLAERINKTYQERMKQVENREKILVGTNQYADPSAEIELSEGIVKFKKRLSVQYEEYWSYFNKEPIRVVVLLFGTLREVKGRADFVAGFLAPAGIKVEWSPVFPTADEAMAWIKENEFDYGIICAPPKTTGEYVEQLDSEITKKLWLDVAGDDVGVSEMKWRDFGISEKFVQGMNQLEKFASIKARWEAKKYGEA